MPALEWRMCPGMGTMALLVCGAFPGTLPAQEPSPAVATGETHLIQSRVMQEGRRVLVTLPESYERTTVGYPVLVVLDGSSHILHATATTRFLAAARNRIPEMIVVAVPNTNRTRDLTPGPGAERFERFFTEELLPWVDSAYRTVPERIILGHSLGGSFVTHALLNRPDLFDVYIAASAPLWRYDSLARDVRAGLARAGKAGKAIYLGVGEHEWAPLRGGVTAFVNTLEDAGPSEAPAWRLLDLPDEDHSSTSLRTLYASLEAHYVPFQYPFFEELAELDSLGGLRALEDHYARFSERSGFSARVPESRIRAAGGAFVDAGKHAEARDLAIAYRKDYPVAAEEMMNRSGYNLLRREQVQQALGAFRENVQWFPDSPNTYDSLADGLCRAGDVEGARRSMQDAVTAAEKRSSPQLDRYRERVAKPCD